MNVDYFFNKDNYRQMAGGEFPIQVVSYADAKTLSGLHYHDFWEMVIITEGHGSYCDGDGNRCQLSPGKVFLLRPGMMHSYDAQSHLHVTNILWLEELFDLNLSDLKDCPGYHALFEIEPSNRFHNKAQGSLSLTTDQLLEVQTILRRMQTEQTKHLPGATVVLQSLLGLLFTFLIRTYADSVSADNELLRLDRVASYIHQNYKNPIRRAQLAKLASMSESNFYRLFCRSFKCTPIEYLTNIRLKYAEELLIKSHKTLADIATETGFTDSNYLGAVFKSRYGISPHQYRVRQKNNNRNDEKNNIVMSCPKLGMHTSVDVELDSAEKSTCKAK